MKIDDSKNKQNLHELIETKNFVEHVSVDCVIFGYNKEKLRVLLLKYHDLDLWSLPGGFVFHDEDLREAAERVLYERTHLKNLFLDQFHTFGRINRTQNNTHQMLLKNKGIEVEKDHWIFQRFITVGYCSLINYSLVETFPDSSYSYSSLYTISSSQLLNIFSQFWSKSTIAKPTFLSLSV